MSLVDSQELPSLFINDINDNFFLTNNLSDNMNYFLTESKKEFPLKQIKFILTKDQLPTSTFLQKKTELKLTEPKNKPENTNGGRWNKEEQRLFAEAVLKYGNEWKKIQDHISSRNITQVRSHAQKFLMKLKENNIVIKMGVGQSMSWTKVMNFLRSKLSYDELKKVLFAVEQSDGRKNLEKKVKKIKKIRKNEKSDCSENLTTNSVQSTTGESSFYFMEGEKERYKYNRKNRVIVKEEEDEEEILKKFIECFNPPSNEMTLNTSFEEQLNEEGDYKMVYKFMDDSSINYTNRIENI